MKIPQSAKNIGKTSKQLPGGSECQYYYCNNGWGIKIFDNEEDRNIAFNNQKQLAKLKLAPPAGRVFNLELPPYKLKNLDLWCDLSDSNTYCYTTRHAKPITDKTYNFIHGTNINKVKKDLTNLRKKCDKIGWEFVDWGYSNVGYYNNKMVIIDCGVLSFSEFTNE